MSTDRGAGCPLTIIILDMSSRGLLADWRARSLLDDDDMSVWRLSQATGAT